MADKTNKKNETTSEMLSQSEAFITKYKKHIIIGVAALVVVVGGVLGIKYGFLQPREEKAQLFISQGQVYAIQGDYDKALKGDGKFPGFVKVAKEYSFTDGANIAKAWAGICYAHTNKYKEAIEYLEDFSPASDKSISPAAIAALANCYASDNQVDKAIDTFKKAAKMADNSAMSPVYLLSAGQLLESQKKNEEALSVYEGIKKDYPNSQLCIPQSGQDGTMISPEIDKYIERVK